MKTPGYLWHHDHPGWRQRSFPVPIRWGLPEGAQPDAFVALAGTMESKGHFVFDQVSGGTAVHLITAGRGIFEIDGTPYPAAAGQALCFFPGQFVHYYDLPGQPWTYSWFQLAGARAEWAVGLAGFNRARPWRQLPDQTPLRLFAELEGAVAEERCEPCRPLTWAWDMIAALTGPAGPGAPGPADLAQAARSLLDVEYDTGLTVEELATRLHVDRSTLFRQFRDRYGTAPKEYLETLRLRKAQVLLRGTARAVKDVAAACGYDDPDYFVRRFRQATGLPPARWRQHQQGPALTNRAILRAD